MALRQKHSKRKEEKMVRRKLVITAMVAVLIGLVSVLHAAAGDAVKININTATAEELTQLKGVGPNYAAEIIAYREKNGPFKMPEDIMQVPGISQKTFEKNSELITVADPAPKKK